MNTTCILISNTYTQDAYLNHIPTENRREVLCEELSNYSSEWHEARQNGLSLSYTLRTANVNYNGERIVEYKGVKYSIYRTYKDGDDIELYLAELAGV